jgi:hypothetical protein
VGRGGVTGNQVRVVAVCHREATQGLGSPEFAVRGARLARFATCPWLFPLAPAIKALYGPPSLGGEARVSE